MRKFISELIAKLVAILGTKVGKVFVLLSIVVVSVPTINAYTKESKVKLEAPKNFSVESTEDTSENKEEETTDTEEITEVKAGEISIAFGYCEIGEQRFDIDCSLKEGTYDGIIIYQKINDGSWVEVKRIKDIADAFIGTLDIEKEYIYYYKCAAYKIDGKSEDFILCESEEINVRNALEDSEEDLTEEDSTEKVPEKVPEEIPEEIPEVITEEIPEVITELTPEVTPEPEVVPAPTPEVVPTPTPEVVPEPTPEVIPEPVVESAPRDPFITNIYDGVNTLRASLGLNTLEVDTLLTSIAQARADDMAANQYFSHYKDGNTEPAFVSVGISLGLSESISCGENIARTTATEDVGNRFIGMWTNSPGHYTNMVDVLWTKIGVAMAMDSNGRWYGVQIFSN